MSRHLHPGCARRGAPRWPALVLGALGVLGAFSCGPRAWADIVILKNGKRLEGRVVEKGDTLIVYLSYGTVTIARARVRSIVKKKTALDRYEERRVALLRRVKTETLRGTAEAPLWYELAEWCARQRLPRARTESLKHALAADPDHALARQALGYVRAGGQWVSGEERLIAMGLVKYQGQWITPQARDEAEKAAQQARKEETEQALREAELRLKQAKAQKLDAERKLLKAQSQHNQAERARLEEERAQLERERAYWLYGQGGLYYPYPVVVAPHEPAPSDSPPAKKSEPPKKQKQKLSPPLSPAHSTAPALNNGTSGPSFPVLP